MTTTNSAPDEAAWDERVRAHLVAVARAGSTGSPMSSLVSYKSVGQALDPDGTYFVHPRYRNLGDCLFRISAGEREAGRPMLTSLVVYGGGQGKNKPGSGLFTRACLPGEVPAGLENTFWRMQVAATVAYWVGRQDAADAARG